MKEIKLNIKQAIPVVQYGFGKATGRLNYIQLS